jgi:hypothetical protein
VGDAFTTVKLRKADFDLCEKHQTFDRVIDSGIGGQFTNGLDHPIPCDWCRHDASILALILYVNNGSAAKRVSVRRTWFWSARWRSPRINRLENQEGEGRHFSEVAVVCWSGRPT